MDSTMLERLRVEAVASNRDSDRSAILDRFRSMLERLDENVRRVTTALREAGLEQNTVVFFSSDNGPHNEGGHRSDFFRLTASLEIHYVASIPI